MTCTRDDGTLHIILSILYLLTHVCIRRYSIRFLHTGRYTSHYWKVTRTFLPACGARKRDLAKRIGLAPVQGRTEFRNAALLHCELNKSKLCGPKYYYVVFHIIHCDLGMEIGYSTKDISTPEKSHTTTIFCCLYLLTLVLIVARSSILYLVLVVASVVGYWVGGIHTVLYLSTKLYGPIN
jgi:hypothetical protein